MRDFTRPICIAAGLLLLAVAVNSAVYRAPNFDNASGIFVYEVKPARVPSSLTEAISGDIWIEEITLSNTTGSDVTCTIQDEQLTPMPLYNKAVAPGIVGFRFSARWMPGGVKWNCGDATSIVGSIRGKRPTR